MSLVAVLLASLDLVLIALLVKQGANVLSPDIFWIAVNVLCAVLGYLYFGAESDGTSISTAESPEAFSGILNNVLLTIFAFGLGAAAMLALCNRVAEGGLAARRSAERPLLEIGSAALALWAVSLCLYVFGNGLPEFIERSDYMVAQSTGPKIVGSVLFLTSHFLLGFNAVKRRYPPVLNWICLAAGVVVYAAYSSRMSAVAVALFAFGACLSRPGKTSAIIMAVSLAVLPIALYVPLYMREMSYQGLVPMAHELFGGNLMRNFEMRVVLANSITAGFMVSALTATTANIDLPYMLTSLNPMPGALTDWAEFTHDLNPSTPYSVLGEWLNFGLPSSILFHGLLGALFAYFGFKARAGDKLYLTVGTGILFLTTLMMLQYNTRMSTRFIYYFVVIVLARFGYRQFRKVID